MPIFELRTIESIKGKQEFDELVVDGVGQLDLFQELIESEHKQYATEFAMIIRYMDYVANGNSLPDTKFKDVTPSGDLVKEYEFKSKHLRIYAIKKSNGKIIILGGLKTTQKADFRRFRSLKSQYLNSIQL